MRTLISTHLRKLEKFGRELTPGELGCSLSHIRLWEKMVKENIPEVLILEDDLLIGKCYLLFLRIEKTS